MTAPTPEQMRALLTKLHTPEPFCADCDYDCPHAEARR